MTGEARFSDCVDIHIFSVAVDLNTTDTQLLIEVLLQYSMRTCNAFDSPQIFD